MTPSYTPLGTSFLFNTMRVNIQILKENLDYCLEKVFFTSATFYMNYDLKVANSYSKKFGGEYVPRFKTIIIQKDESECFDLIFATAIHELAHHVCFIKNGNLTHNDEFYSIQRQLLYASFELRYINPYRLALAEEFLSRYSERKRIKKECVTYTDFKRVRPIYQIEFTYFKHKSKGFKYSNVCSCWYRFIKVKQEEEKKPYRIREKLK